MSATAMTALGFCIIFVATTAGAALVFFFKGEMSGKQAVFTGKNSRDFRGICLR